MTNNEALNSEVQVVSKVDQKEVWITPVLIVFSTDSHTGKPYAPAETTIGAAPVSTVVGPS